MPSKSKKQAKLMSAVAHSPAFAKKVGIPQSVGQEFHDADKKVGKYMHGKHGKGHKKHTGKIHHGDMTSHLHGHGSPDPHAHKSHHKANKEHGMPHGMHNGDKHQGGECGDMDENCSYS